MIVEARLDTLVRSCLAATARLPKPDQVAKKLAPFAPATVSITQLRELVALAFTRVTDDDPEPAPWKQLVESAIPAEVLGADRVGFRARDVWVAAIVGAHLGVWSGDGAPPKLGPLCDALVWRELGLTTKPAKCPDEIRAMFVRKHLATPVTGKAETALRLLAASLVRAPRAETKLLREALVRMWLVGGSLGAASFADDLRRVALAAREGVFGDRKVFLASVHRELVRLPAWSSLSLDEFKRRVLVEHRAGNVELARADLVGAMDPALVHASETIGDGARFHFLVREMA